MIQLKIDILKSYFWSQGYELNETDENHMMMSFLNKSYAIDKEFFEYLIKLNYTNLQIFSYYEDKYLGKTK